MLYKNNNCKSIYLPAFRYYISDYNHSSSYEAFIEDFTSLEYFHAPQLSEIVPLLGYDGCALLTNVPKIKNIIVGTVTNNVRNIIYGQTPNLIDIEIGENTTSNLYLREWIPTNALSMDDNTLVTDDMFASNIDELLYNFMYHIVHKLNNNTNQTKCYLYLSEVMYNLVTGNDDNGYTKTHILPGSVNTYDIELNDILSVLNWGITK